MNKLKQLVWIGLLLGWSSCNRFVDQQPTPDNGPPSASIQTLFQQYPQAQDIFFTTIVNNQLWQTNFTQQHQRYQGLLSFRRLLTANQLVDNSIPDSLTRLVAPTVVAGGTFSNPRLRQYNGYGSSGNQGQEMRLYADYTWQQQTYTASWTIAKVATGQISYQFELLPSQMASYETDTQTEIPEPVQTALQQQNLIFNYAWVQMDVLHQRNSTLDVQRQGQSWQLNYDNAGQLLAVTYQKVPQVFQQLEQLPLVIQQYLQRPELVGFGLKGPNAALLHNTYGSLGTYRVNVQKDNQAWLMTFSDQGQLISRSFLSYGVF